MADGKTGKGKTGDSKRGDGKTGTGHPQRSGSTGGRSASRGAQVRPAGYEPRAASVAAMLKSKGIDATAIPGGKGQFDVLRDGELVFSKHSLGRFPGEAEIASLVGA